MKRNECGYTSIELLVCLISLAVLSGAVYIGWLVIKALQKYVGV